MSRPDSPLLAIETSTTTARVAVVDGAGAPLSGAEATAERHSANVMRLVDATLRAAGCKPAELGAIACGAGPGSFTGLRVGLSVAKGLAMAAGPPLILVSSLEALALDVFDALGAGGGAVAVADLAVPCIDAGKGEVYAAVYRHDRETLVRAEPATAEPWRLAPDALAARLAAWPQAAIAVTGRGAERHAAALAAALGRAPRVDVAGPSAIASARLALLRHRRGERDDLDGATPLYGRPPDITRSGP